MVVIFEALYCSYKEFEQLYQKLEIVNFTLSLFHLVLVVILFFQIWILLSNSKFFWIVIQGIESEIKKKNQISKYFCIKILWTVLVLSSSDFKREWCHVNDVILHVFDCGLRVTRMVTFFDLTFLFVVTLKETHMLITNLEHTIIDTIMMRLKSKMIV